MMQEEEFGRGDPFRPLDWRRLLPFEPAAASDRLGWVGLETARYFRSPSVDLNIPGLADRLGADIGFEDEAGVGIMTRSGRTWGLVGKTPVVRVCMQRGGYNVLSMVTPTGEMKSSVTADSIDSVHYIEFLKNLIRDRERPLILLVDRISFHRSQKVRYFVRAHRAQV